MTARHGEAAREGEMVTNKLMTEELSATLDGVTAARVDIDSGSGNLTVDELSDGEQLLATGTLQYFETQGKPTRSITEENGRAILAIKGADSGRPWFHFPWAACNGANEWQIHLNRAVSSDITAHTGGGNLTLDLGRMTLNHLSADTGGGNIQLTLPDHAADLEVAAKTGAGNLTVEIGEETTGTNTLEAHSGAGNVCVKVPRNLAVTVHARSGWGKLVLEPPLRRI